MGCGAIGTTRLVASSLKMWSRPIHLQESAQFLVPLASIRGSKTLSQDGSFTLNQFNIVMPFDEAGRDLVQIHGYPYNKSMDDACPRCFAPRSCDSLGDAALKHLTVGLGYLPSWWSPGFDVTIERPSPSEHLAQVVVGGERHGMDVAAAKIRAINARLLRVAPYLGVVPAYRWSHCRHPVRAITTAAAFLTRPTPGKARDGYPRSHTPVAQRASHRRLGCFRPCRRRRSR